MADRITNGTGTIRIDGDRLTLRAYRPDEIDAEWRVMADAYRTDAYRAGFTALPDEGTFRTRLAKSGRMHDGWLDLAIDVDGTSVGRIQTYVPANRPLPPGMFEVGIGLREDMRGKHYGREALALFTGWLFGHAAAEVLQADTLPSNHAMRAVFAHVGWHEAGELTEGGQTWLLYRITRAQWESQTAG